MNSFFKKKGPFSFKKIIKNIRCNYNLKKKHELLKIYDIKPLLNANKNNLTFLNNVKYKELSLKTKATACITTEKLSKYLPTSCKKILVENVLFAVSQISKMFYPYADMDYPDINLLKPKNQMYKKVSFGKNVLIGKNVIIGNNTIIGSNSIIESNVQIGKNCVIGSFVIIKNSIIKDYVCIQDGTKIGIKGFGFIPNRKNNFKTPHIGKVIINNFVELGSSCTIDRGSMSDTIIDENTYLDNQVHVAHNVKIGKNCIIAGQVGFAGSTTLGDNVVIGGQAGISGHLKIGNNVSIGGGSGVIKNIPDNKKVMGYPAIDFKNFVKQWREKENE